MKYLSTIAAIVFAGLVLASCQNHQPTLQLLDLKTNNETTPLTVETAHPQFSWRMQTSSGTGQQKAYRINVTNAAGTEVWNSGTVQSGQSVGITYQGPALEPAQQYQWQLTVWREDGSSAETSATFETGFMQPDISAWAGAQWIGSNQLVFDAHTLSVFKLSADIQLHDGSERAALVFGGNDIRLTHKHLNTFQLEQPPNTAFVAVELDISPLQQPGGQAVLNVYRAGHTPNDSVTKPLARLPIPQPLINTSNRYQPHRIYVESIFGTLNIYVDGTTNAHLVTPYNPALPPYIPQGLSVNPYGQGGDYVSYPMVGDIGFWVQPGNQASFHNLTIRHCREPSNALFQAGTVENASTEIFSSPKISRNTDGSYVIAAADEPVLLLADPSNDGAPLLRHTFTTANKVIKKARIYATARGIYELYLNGQRVGNDYFAPGLTQYNKHHTNQAYDVTDLINKGAANVVGAMLSEGWWSGNITYTGSNWNYFGDRQSLLARLIITYEDGSTDDIITEPEHWKTFHGGPIRYGSFFQGEVYDATREAAINGWSTPNYDDSQWIKAEEIPLQGTAFISSEPDPANQRITSYDNMALVGHVGNSPKVVKTLQAQTVSETAPGVFVYDMGQNMVGVPQIQLEDHNTKGPVVLRYAEVLYPDLAEYSPLQGTPMMENIRAAHTHDIYYPKGENDVIQPRFTFHGYRYVEISGLSEALPLSSVKGLVISSVERITADYTTSNPLVNKLWQNITWSMRGNFLSIPTDTPARNERMGWSGDINVFARTANYMAAITPFIERHMQAMRDTQSNAGRFADVAPIGGGFGGTLWGSAGIIVPWETYLKSGDLTLLRRHYPAMVAYINHLATRNDPKTGALTEGLLGDWLSPEGNRNDNTLLWSAYQVYLLDIMQQIAILLDQPADAEQFAQAYTQRKATFNHIYVDPDTGKTRASGLILKLGQPEQFDPSLQGTPVDTQASYAIPLAMNVFDESNIARAQKHLLAAVERKNTDDAGATHPPYSLMTGFIGTAALLDALSDAGENTAAYKLLQQTSYPSWLYPVVNGATTIWERLNSYTHDAGFGGNNSMNSFNHYAFGAVGAWMMGHSLGIHEGSEAGFKHFVLAPTPDPTGEMTFAKGHYDSHYGRIESAWTTTGNQTTYRFTVPPNTSATLFLAAADSANITVNRPSLVGEQLEQQWLYELEPGQYTFVVQHEPRH